MEYDDKDEKAISRDDINPPDGWEWKGQWTVDMNRAVDEEGNTNIMSDSVILYVIYICTYAKLKKKTTLRLGVLC